MSPQPQATSLAALLRPAAVYPCNGGVGDGAGGGGTPGRRRRGSNSRGPAGRMPATTYIAKGVGINVGTGPGTGSGANSGPSQAPVAGLCVDARAGLAASAPGAPNTTPMRALPVLLNGVFNLPIASHLAAFLRISPSSAAASTALLTSFFSCPAGELRLPGSLTPKMRALVAFAASSASGSCFWTSVTPAMPSALTGIPAAPPRLFAAVRSVTAIRAPDTTSRDSGSAFGDTRHQGTASHSKPPPQPQPQSQLQPQSQPAMPPARKPDQLQRGDAGGSRGRRKRTSRQASDYSNDGRQPSASEIAQSPPIPPSSTAAAGFAAPAFADDAGALPAVQIATELAAAMSAVPHTCTPALVQRARAVLGERRAEVVMLVAAAMGFFNCWVDIIDVAIDPESFKYLRAHIGDLGTVNLGRHFDDVSIAAAAYDGSSGRPTPSGSLGGVFRPLKVFSAFRTPSASSSRRQVGNVTRSIPQDAFGQRESFQDTCGFYFYWLDAFKDKVRLVFCSLCFCS